MVSRCRSETDFENYQFAAIAELTGGSPANDFKVLAPMALQDNSDVEGSWAMEHAIVQQMIKHQQRTPTQRLKQN